MRLSVPFGYSIEYVVKRKRTVETTHASAAVDIDVDAVQGEVKLAFELGCCLLEDGGHDNRRPDRSVFYAPVGHTVRVYRAENAYWVEICAARDAPAVIADRHRMDRDPFAVFYEAGDTTHMIHRARSDGLTREQVEQKHAGDGGLRRWDEDASKGRSAIEMLIRRRAEYDMREIDGRLCMRVSEPALGYMFHIGTQEPAPEAARKGAPRPPAPPPKPRLGFDQGDYLIVEQFIRRTPAGFSLKWDLRPGARRWRIDEVRAAIAYAERREGPAALRGNLVQIEYSDTSDCLFEGNKSLLEDAIDGLRRVMLEHHMAEMDGAQLSALLDLDHVYERDAGRLSPEYIGAARRLFHLVDRSFEIEVPTHLSDVMKVGNSQRRHHFHGGDLPQTVAAVRQLADAFAVYGARPRDGRDWIDRAIPCGVLADPAAGYDIAEVLTLRDGQRLIDAGCDHAILDALKEASRGETHVISIQGDKDRLLPYAGVVVDDGDGIWRLGQIIGPPGTSGRKLEAECRAKFEDFVDHANALGAENHALMSLAV